MQCRELAFLTQHRSCHVVIPSVGNNESVLSSKGHSDFVEMWISFVLLNLMSNVICGLMYKVHKNMHDIGGIMRQSGYPFGQCQMSRITCPGGIPCGCNDRMWLTSQHEPTGIASCRVTVRRSWSHHSCWSFDLLCYTFTLLLICSSNIKILYYLIAIGNSGTKRTGQYIKFFFNQKDNISRCLSGYASNEYLLIYLLENVFKDTPVSICKLFQQS